MGHKNKISLIDQVNIRIDSMFVPGRSRNEDKIREETNDRIYSYETRRAYKKHACYFVKWVKGQSVKPEIGHKPRILEECK